MRKLNLSILGLLFLALACDPSSVGTSGRVRLSLRACADLAEMSKGSVADYVDLPGSEDFTLTLKNASSMTVWSGKVSEWDEQTLLQEGGYLFCASCGEEGAEGPAAAWFYGQTPFTVRSGETTPVGIEASLSNIILKISCTADFKRYFPTAAFSIRTGAGHSFSLAPDSGEVLFVDAFRFTLEANLESASGVQTNFSRTFDSGITAGTCYTLKMDIANAGGTVLTISFNDTVQTVQITEELYD